MLRVHAQQASNGFWVVEEKKHNYYYGYEQKQSQSYFLHHESRLTMKSTHKIAQRNATGHASTNKRMSHSNAKIGFDAIVSLSPQHAGLEGVGIDEVHKLVVLYYYSIIMPRFFAFLRKRVSFLRGKKRSFSRIEINIFVIVIDYLP